MYMKNWSTVSLSLFAALSMSLMTTVYADDAEKVAETTAEAEHRGLETIVVTARKRKESLQEVPLSITVITGEDLSNMGIDNFYDTEIPGVNIAQGGMNEIAFIRGVGQSSGNFGFEQSVPFYMDGTYYGRARATRLAFLDIQSMEILKGPQPTYLGKNAIAGAINMTSKRPTDELSFDLGLSHEFEHNETSITAAVSGALTEDFRARAVIKTRDLKDGWMTNTVNDRTGPTNDDTLGRVSFEWDASETVQVFSKFEFVDTEMNGRNSQQILCTANAVIDPALEDCTFNTTQAVNFDPANYPSDFYNDTNPVAGDNFINIFDMKGGQVAVEWQISDSMDFTSTTSYYEYVNDLFVDFSHSSDDRGATAFIEKFDQISQELRIVSSGDDVNWMAGVYIDHANNDDYTESGVRQVVTPMGAMTVNMATIRITDEEVDSWAVFAETDITLSDEVAVKVGARYTEISRSYSFSSSQVRWLDGEPFANGTVLAGGTFSKTGDRTDSKFQPSVTLEWKPESNAMYFASVKQGFKSGGFDHQPANAGVDPAFKPEEVVAYEIGTKLTLADGEGRLNISLFSATYENLQVSSFDTETISFRLLNAGEATTTGLEADIAWVLSNNFEVSAYVAFLDAEYGAFDGAACYSNPAQTAEQGCLPNVDDAGNPIGGKSQSLSGQELQFAPGFSGKISLNYDSELASGDYGIFGQLDMFFTDDYQIDSKGDPDTRQGAYQTFDARFGIEATDGSWDLAIIARNLTDEKIIGWMGDTPLSGHRSHFALLKRPRQIGIQFNYHFSDH